MALAIALLFCKALAIGAAVVVVESSFAKLRLYKIPEFTVASFTLAVLAVVIFLFGPGFGNLHLSVFGAAATITAVGVLLLELLMLRSQEVWEQLRLYALGVAARGGARDRDRGERARRQLAVRARGGRRSR